MFSKLISLFALIVLVMAAFGASTSPARQNQLRHLPRLRLDQRLSSRSMAFGTAGTTPAPGPLFANMTDFDLKNRWIIDRGNGTPSVNIVVLSFVEPLKLLNQTTDAGTLNGVPRGMTADVVNYFKSRGIRVMLSIGGITYVDPWNQALTPKRDAAGTKRGSRCHSTRRRDRDRLRREFKSQFGRFTGIYRCLSFHPSV